jgi:accessory colonization factor AcfC
MRIQLLMLIKASVHLYGGQGPHPATKDTTTDFVGIAGDQLP